jgi:glycogen debranching enzyme
VQQGADGIALTWMDARVNGVPVTQRFGKPVEVNALWLRTLQVAGSPLFERAASSFVGRFVRADDRGLLDVADPDDGSLRPNQLLAVSLPIGVLDDASARAVVMTCRDWLLTPLGPRSLDPADSRYKPYHRGSPPERDFAYHQGTVWPWLLGPYVEAGLRTGVDVSCALDGIEAHLGEWGLGSVSETADAAAPNAASGCPFQAWSVAEVLRARGLVRAQSAATVTYSVD